MKKNILFSLSLISFTIISSDRPRLGRSSGTQQRSFWGSLFQPSSRPIKKKILRPEETVTVYRDMNADPGIDAYSGMTNTSSILYPTKESVPAQNRMPSMYPFEDGYAKEVRKYPTESGKVNTIWIGKSQLKTPKPQKSTWRDYFNSWKNWWNGR